MTDNPNCNKCIHNEICDHNNLGFENCNSYLPELKCDEIQIDFCGVLCEFAEELIKKAKAEAIKEFAEKLERKCEGIPEHYFDYEMVEYHIDNLVKEMTEPSLLDKKFGGDAE